MTPETIAADRRVFLASSILLAIVLYATPHGLWTACGAVIDIFLFVMAVIMYYEPTEDQIAHHKRAGGLDNHLAVERIRQ
jgi:hypothetical protein